MQELFQGLAGAFSLIRHLDADLFGIILLSLQVSLMAVTIAALVGLPLGALLAVRRFAGRHFLIVSANVLMGLPPVVVGLVVYLMLSRSGPLGVLELLYTPAAMIIAQTLLILPILVSLTRQAIEDLFDEYQEMLRAMGASGTQLVITLLWDARFSLLTTLFAGLGRGLGEVGAVMIVGGNISYHTRVMTTSIALETARGEFSIALGLGVILVGLTFLLHLAIHLTSRLAGRI